MREQPAISVIVIFLNAGRFFEEAIESVFGQTYDHWELLLVDDGSTDGSTDSALRYAARSPNRIRYMEHNGHQNRGMSASRNLGIRNARGKYFALLDADDVWLPFKLEHQVAILESHPEAAMVYGPAQCWHSWAGNAAAKRDCIQELFVETDRIFMPPALLQNFLQHVGATPCPSSALVRRSVTERTGEFEEAFRGMYEDQVFFSKVCLAAPIFVSGECNFKYRRHPDAACAVPRTPKQIHSARLNFLNWLKDHLSKQKVRDRDVWRALRSAFQAEDLRPYRRRLFHHLFQYYQRLTANFLRSVKLAVRWAIPAPVRFWLRGR